MEVLEAETENVAYELFKRMCKEDGVECPYDENDFYIEKVTLAGLHFVCISIPESSPCVSYALRVYFVTVCERENPEKKHTRYFYIKKFREIEKVHVMYVSPKEELILGTELTDRADDRAYERCAIAKHFMRVLIDEKIIGIDAESDEM